MFFTIKELKSWLLVSIFEVAMALTAAVVFSVLLVLKIENHIVAEWWTIFAPLFAFDILTAYFDIIVFIRLYLALDRSLAAKRLIINAVVILLLVIFKVLLCQKLEGTKHFPYSVIYTPLFVLLFLLLVRSCILSDKF